MENNNNDIMENNNHQTNNNQTNNHQTNNNQTNNHQTNNNQTKPFYSIQLYGANPNSQISQAKVSLNKIDYVCSYKWYLGKDGYPFAYIKGGRVPLHRYVWWINTGYWTNTKIDSTGKITKVYVDHINRDKLDACDENLRASTPAENSYNKTSKNEIIDPNTLEPLHHIKLTKSGYSVSLTKSGKTNRISKIASLEEAKNIYNMMALELFGEFSVLYN